MGDVPVADNSIALPAKKKDTAHMNKALRITALAALVAVVLTGCSSKGADTAKPTSTQASPSSSAPAEQAFTPEQAQSLLVSAVTASVTKAQKSGYTEKYLYPGDLAASSADKKKQYEILTFDPSRPEGAQIADQYFQTGITTKAFKIPTPLDMTSGMFTGILAFLKQTLATGEFTIVKSEDGGAVQAVQIRTNKPNKYLMTDYTIVIDKKDGFITDAAVQVPISKDKATFTPYQFKIEYTVTPEAKAVLAGAYN